MKTHRYAKQVPGHHVQVDVTFLKLIGTDGRATRLYQYTAIDDVTRISALRVYPRHTQKNAIGFLDHVIETFPFRIHEVRCLCRVLHVTPSGYYAWAKRGPNRRKPHDVVAPCDTLAAVIAPPSVRGRYGGDRSRPVGGCKIATRPRPSADRGRAISAS